MLRIKNLKLKIRGKNQRFFPRGLAQPVKTDYFNLSKKDNLFSKSNVLQKYSSKSFTAGFTLIELMVATSIFVIIMVIGLSTLMSVNSANKRAQAIRSAMDNLNFAVENMSRNIRYGYDYGCLDNFGMSVVFNHDCHTNTNTSYPSSGSSGIAFHLFNNTTSNVDNYVYQLNGQSIERCISTNNSSYTCAPITSPDLTISTLRFSVSGSSISDGYQPGVLLYLEGMATVGKETSPFKIQTFFTQRQYEQ